MAAIDVEIRDKIAATIQQKIAAIGTAATQSYRAVQQLQSALSSLRTGRLNIPNAALRTGGGANFGATASAANAAASANKNLAGSFGVANTAASGFFQRLIGGKSAISTFQTGVRDTTQTIRSFASAYLLFRGLGSGVQALDTARSAENRLRQASDIRDSSGKLNVGESEKRLNEVLRRTYELANEARAPVLEVADAFLKIDQAVGKLGIGQEKSFKIVSTLTKSLSASGFDAGKIGQVLNQLGETFSQGKLNSDEFRRVRETLPGLIDELARTEGGMGNVIKLAEDQKLTLDKLIPAIIRYGATVDENFGRAPATVSQGFQILKNQITEFFGQLDKSVPISDTLNTVFQKIGDNLPLIAKGAALAATSLAAMFAIPAAGFLAATLATTSGQIALITSGILLFGDKIKVTADGAVNLHDVFKGIGATIASWKIPETVSSFVNKPIPKDGIRDQIATAVNSTFEKAPEWVQTTLGAIQKTKDYLSNNPLEAVNDGAKSLSSLIVATGVAIEENWNDKADKNIFSSALEKLPQIAALIKEIPVTSVNSFAKNIYQASEDRLALEKMLEEIAKPKPENLRAGLRDDSMTRQIEALGAAAETTTERLKRLADAKKLQQETQKQFYVDQSPFHDDYLKKLGFERTPKPDDSAKNFFDNIKAQNQTQQGTLGLPPVETVNQIAKGFQDISGTVTNTWPQLKIQGDSVATTLGGIQTTTASINNTARDTGTTFSTAFTTAAEAVRGLTTSLTEAAAAQRDLNAAQSAGGGGGGTGAGFTPGGGGGRGFGGFGFIGGGAGFGGSGPASSYSAAGFASGGYTGNIGRSSVAGVVHGEEFVVNPEATKRNRALLEAMNSGRTSTGSSGASSSGSGSQMNVTVQNYGGAQVETRQLSDGEILILIDEKAKAIARQEAPKAVASEMRNPNSHVSKSLTRNTTSQRRR